MPTIEVGRVCVKLNGREAGHKCIIVDVIDKNFVLITGPKKASGVRRRRTNVKHLEPTEDTIDIKKGASDEDVAKAIGRGKKAETFKEPVLPNEIMMSACSSPTPSNTPPETCPTYYSGFFKRRDQELNYDNDCPNSPLGNPRGRCWSSSKRRPTRPTVVLL